MKLSKKSLLAVGASAASVVGLVLAPAVYAGNTTTVTVNVAKAASVATTNGAVTLNINPTVTGSATTGHDTVTVGTNSTAGYVLKINASAANLTGAGNLVPTGGTIAAPAALSTNSWGFRFDDATATTGFGNSPVTADEVNVAAPTNTKWAPVPTVATTIRSTAVASPSGDTVNVYFGAKADFNQAQGAYTGTVTFSVTAN